MQVPGILNEVKKVVEHVGRHLHWIPTALTDHKEASLFPSQGIQLKINRNTEAQYRVETSL